MVPVAHEHRISFYLFVSPSVSFISVLEFLIGRPFVSLVKCTLRNFILCHAIVSSIVFLISFPDSLLLVARNATNFNILILYLATWLNSLLSSNRFFWVESWGFTVYKVIAILFLQCSYCPNWPIGHCNLYQNSSGKLPPLKEITHGDVMYSMGTIVDDIVSHMLKLIKE